MSKILSLALVLVVLTPTFIFSTISGNAMINNSTSENSTTTAPTRRETNRTNRLSTLLNTGNKTNRLTRNAATKATTAKKPIKKANSKKLTNSTIAKQTPPNCQPQHRVGDVYTIAKVDYKVTKTDRWKDDSGAESGRRCVVEVSDCNNQKPAVDMNKSSMGRRIRGQC